MKVLVYLITDQLVIILPWHIKETPTHYFVSSIQDATLTLTYENVLPK